MKKYLTKFMKEEGMPMPWGYAVSYRDFRLQGRVCYPLGIHLVVRWSRDFTLWLMDVGYPGYRQRIEHEAFLAGRKIEQDKLKDEGRPPAGRKKYR